MSATIHDVAREADVNVNTVCKVLRGATNVRPYIKSRVMEAVSKLSYSPSQVAKGLRKSRSNIVTLSIIELENPYFGNLARRINANLNANGYEVVIAPSIERNIELASTFLSAGAIIGYPAWTDKLMLLKNIQPNVVSVGSSAQHDLGEISDVSVDFPSAYADLASELLRMGRRKIAFCSMRNFHPVRLAGKFLNTQRVLLESGVNPVIACERGYVPPEEICELVRRGEVDAVLCENDIHAAELYALLAQAGLKVSSDVEVVGCDGTLPLKGMMSVAFDFDAFAKMAVSLFLRQTKESSAGLRESIPASVIRN